MEKHNVIKLCMTNSVTIMQQAFVQPYLWQYLIIQGKK